MKKILLIVILTTCAALDARADDRVAKLEARIQQLELRVQKLEALLTLAEAFPPNSLPPQIPPPPKGRWGGGGGVTWGGDIVGVGGAGRVQYSKVR